MNMKQTKRRTRGRTLLIGALVLLLSGMGGACDDPVEPGHDFLLRTPGRSGSTIEASAGSTETVLFEWEPAAGATSYTIAFFPGEPDQIDNLEADFDNPIVTWQLSSPNVEEVPVDPTNPEDVRTVTLVQVDVPVADIAAALAAAGVEAGERVNTLVSVYAEAGGDRWRSPSLHPVDLVLQ